MQTAVHDRAAEIAKKLHESSIKKFTFGRILRGVAQQAGGGRRDLLAESLHISNATVARALTLMMDDKLALLEDGVPRRNGPGRPVAPLQLRRKLAMIGIAVICRGGTAHALACTVVYLDGSPVSTTETPEVVKLGDRAQDQWSVLGDEIARVALRLKYDSGIDPDDIIGCGVTLGEYIGRSGGTGRSYGGSISLGVSLREPLENQIGVPVVVGNDVTSLAVRKNLRPGQPAENYAMLVPIDFGVGGALVVNNKSWLGAHGMAGEPGHLPAYGVTAISRLPDDSEDSAPIALEASSPPCRCEVESQTSDYAGHVEAFASPYGICRRAELSGGAIAPGTTAQLATRADRQASLLFYQGGAALGSAAVSIINWFDPERVLVYLPTELSMTFDLAGDYYVRGFWDELKKRAFLVDQLESVVTIKTVSEERLRSQLASGAAYLVLRRLVRLINGEDEVSLIGDTSGRAA